LIIEYRYSAVYCPVLSLIWGRIGFDGIVETGAAGRGFSLASLKNEKLKINAKNDNFALAAA
jgi:hypothetical protein